MKKKQRTFLSVLALILSLAALAVSAFTFSRLPEDQTHLIDDLYQENQELKNQLEELTGRLDQFLTVSSLSHWSLDVKPWADSTGADVIFTAAPADYREGVSATFLVMRDGKQVISVPCLWDGSVFTAAAALDAADGYSYYCLLDSPGGNQQLTLMTPESPDAGIPVYLQSGLSSYCNLVVSDWFREGDTLVLTSTYAQVQLPQLSASGDVQLRTTELVLRHNGQVLTRENVLLNPSEVAGSFDATLENVRLPLQELQPGDVLELSLEVVLSDGRHLYAFGINWYLENGQLTSAVG